MQLRLNIATQFISWTYLLLFPFWLPAEPVRSFQYDTNNNLVKEIKGDERSIIYEYDHAGRIIKETSSDGAIIQYNYDKNGNCTQMTDVHGTTTYVYDTFNQLISVQFPNTNPMYYSYDGRGRLTGIIYPNRWRISYDYDKSNRLLSVVDRTGKTKYDYDNTTNNLTKVTLPNGTTTEYQYDRSKRITDVIHKRSDGVVIAGYNYSFDGNGNRTQIKETGPLDSRNTTCIYDKLNRLVSVESPDGYEKYSYDGIGNRLTKETKDGLIHYEYDQSNHLIKAGDTRFFYDVSGNLKKKISPQDTAEYQYDVHDNLIEFRNSKHIVKYSYDGARRRISKIVDGIVTHYINDVSTPITQVALKTTASNQVCAHYTYGLSRLYEVLPSGIGFYLHDYPDRNVIALVNTDQQVVNKYHYDNFGYCLSKSSSYPNDFLYAGESFEEESQLIFLRNRYYDPELGRFISADPDFGSKTNAQSLNPYTYVNNNPLNFIDPTGLRSAKACAYPTGTKTSHGISSVGHGFWVLTYDDGEVVTIGRYPGGVNKSFKENFDQICPGTASYEWPATDEQIDQIIAKMKEGRYLGVAGNCINGLECGLKILGIEHPSLKSAGVSSPGKAIIWLESLHGRTDFYDATQEEMSLVWNDDPWASSRNKPQLPVSSHSSGDVGGVSLNKTAKLLGHISEVQGATYDNATGQLIIIGKKNISLPEMDFDDLAVAVRAIYGLGGKAPQNPGVSLDWDPDHPVDFQKIIEKGKKPPPMLARYDGQTKKTRFGWIMFEADRVLKCLSLGRDNLTGKKIDVHISGYESLPDRYLKHKSPKEYSETRLWFVPKEMTIFKNKKGRSIIFKTAKMAVLTETTHKHKKRNNSEAEKFADHFTENYSKFAEYYPILKELKRLGKITAVVKWIKENKIPFDLSLFKKYKPIRYETPSKTPAMCIIRKIKHKDKSTEAVTVAGGVVYHLDESNFHEVETEKVNPITKAALKARPSENVFSWTFQSPLDSLEYQAVAQTIEQTVKVGNIKKARLDIRIPAPGIYPLELVRFYNSFNDQDIGLGRGWDVVSTKLRFPRPKMNVQWDNDPVSVTLYPEIFVEEEGHELRYALIGLGKNHQPLYKSDEGQAILSETKQGFTLNKLDGKELTFNLEGKILSKSFYNSLQIAYHYNNDNRLVAIAHSNGKKIQLLYDQNRLVSIIGPGGKLIQYNYDSQEQLKDVADGLGIIESYAYDADKNLNVVFNGRHEKIFEAVYDDYHRATTEIARGERQTKTFDLKARTLHVDKMGQRASSCRYDSNYRLLQASDSLDRLVKMTYDKGQTKPKAISDTLGNEKKFTYDQRGNIIRILDSVGIEQRFWYNQNDQLFASLDGMGRGTLYFYNEQGRLTKVCPSAQLIMEDQVDGRVNFNYTESHMTEYGYDSNFGLLLFIKEGGELAQKFTYNEEGMLISISGPQGYTLHKSYDERGRLTKLWDPQNEGFEYLYDDRDQLIRLSGSNGTIEYLYDTIGNLSSIKDACGGITYYSYDAYANLTQVRDPLGGLTIYEYDTGHNLKRIILPNGSVREVTYDAINRPTADIW